MQNFTCNNASFAATNNTTNACPQHRRIQGPQLSQIYVTTSTVLLSILIPVIISGNAFVILAFARSRRLRTLTNYFVVSLAIADILVGSLSLPIFTTAIHKGPLWQHRNPTMIKLWTSIDMITTIASIVNLMYISIDRFICIQFPLKYFIMVTKRRVLVMIIISWIYGLVNSSLVIFTYERGRPKPQVVLVVTFTAFLIPLLVVLLMYGQVARIALSHRIRMNAQQEKNDEKASKGKFSLIKELKATRTLAVVIGAFFVCFVGYFVLWLRTSICNEWIAELRCKPFPNISILATSFQWIKYFNSTLNPFIYTVMYSDMRKALKRFISGKIFATDSSSFELSSANDQRVD